MDTQIPASKIQTADASILAKELLRDVEMSTRPLANIALSTSRLARLLNDFEFQKIFEYESSGYPKLPTGVQPDIWKLLIKADRIYKEADSEKKGEIKEYGYLESIEELEQLLSTYRISLQNAQDPDISIASANPNQYVHSPRTNAHERQALTRNIALTTKRISQRRHFLYKYVLGKNMELAYSTAIDDILFSSNLIIAERIQALAPDEVQKFNAIHDNLRSENSEDWANAVHGCRRLLQSIADAIYPPRADVKKDINGKSVTIKLGNDNYINRLIAYVEEKSTSEKYKMLVGSNLSFMGDRLDATSGSTQKGSHAVVERHEAERYVLHTFVVLGDILLL